VFKREIVAGSFLSPPHYPKHVLTTILHHIFLFFKRNNSSVVLDSEKTNSSYVMVIPKYGLSLYDFMYERQETLSFEEARRTYKKILKALCKLRQVY
jgi:hypothetical protein